MERVRGILFGLIIFFVTTGFGTFLTSCSFRAVKEEKVAEEKGKKEIDDDGVIEINLSQEHRGKLFWVPHREPL